MITIINSPINSNSEVMGGTLVFKNTRVPAQTLLDYIDDGYSFEEFLENFPSVQKKDAVLFLKIARDTNNNENYPG